MRKVLVAALTAALVGVPAVAANATIDHCPAGVSAISGKTQPTHAQIGSWLAASAAAHSVPLAVLKVIAYKESTWRQYTGDGHALVSSDATCGLGIMQVTADDRSDAVQLASDPAYNIDEGAKILAAKYAGAQGTPPADTGQGDDPDVIENWYYALCLYNGCTNDPAYADAAAGILSDPFRRLPLEFRMVMPPAGFSRPQDADPTYTLPSAFQARHDPDVFVFYDAATGAVTKTVPYPTHLASAPPVVSYPFQTTGPDAPTVTCFQCSGWRLAEGAGLSGRAHWTNSITGPDPQSEITWTFTGVNGRYRVDAYLPPLGADTLGTATYGFWDGATFTQTTIDQNARKGGWTTLTERSFANGVQVNSSDLSPVGGQKIVADAIRITAVPSLSLALSGPGTITYGQRVGLRMTLTHGGAGLSGQNVALFRRIRGTTAWQGLGYWKTGADGFVEVNAAPDRSYEYTARFSPSPSTGMAPAASGVVRVDVRTRVAALLSAYSTFGEPVTLRTSVAPGHPGQSVLVQRWYSNAWHTVSSLRLDSYSRAGWTFRMTNTTSPCGSYRREYFRVVKPADYDHVAGISGTLALDVHRC